MSGNTRSRPVRRRGAAFGLGCSGIPRTDRIRRWGIGARFNTGPNNQLGWLDFRGALQVIAEKEMVEQPDTQQISRFPQSCGERPLLRARRGISGGMAMKRTALALIPDNRRTHEHAGLRTA